MKILVMDDERPALELMLETLGRLCPESEIVFFTVVKDFLEYKGKSDIDVAFLDIELGKMTGIELALELKKYSPKCNIIFVTSYSKYGTESFRARPSGYVTKPYTDEDIRHELEDLKYPVKDSDAKVDSQEETPQKDEGGIKNSDSKKLRCTTFGNFVVYGKDGKVFNFSRTKSKELLAYLIDCAGFPITSWEIAKDVYEVELDKQVSKNISKIIISLMDDLKKVGYDGVVIKQNRQIYINKQKVSCDLYDAMNGDVTALNSFRGEYMIEYSWAEISDSVARLLDK